MRKDELTRFVKQTALQLGFGSCGVAKAEKLEPEAVLLEQWLNQNRHGEMHYMANHFDKRIDPRLLVDGAKSVVCLSYNYFTEKKQTDPTAPKLAMYAFGKDYHDVVRAKLEELLRLIREEVGEVNGRCFVDSAPVMERAWAQRSGVGWVGKNSLTLTKGQGSYFFLAELIIDLELNYDSLVKDYCGNCTKCVDACPTGAIYEPYKVDGSKCISYFTIELKEAIPASMKGKMDNWMFGCDVCQQVCPINARAVPHQEEAFEPHPELLGMTREDWMNLSEETFKQLFKGSAVKRTKYSGLKRNITFIQ
jgi:epoxyqueuosine reductase